MLASNACFDPGHHSITRPAPGVVRAHDPIRKHPVPNCARLQLAAGAEAIPVPAEPVVLEQDAERRSDGIDRPDRIERDERIDAKIEDRKAFCAVVCRVGPSRKKSKRRVQEPLSLRRASLIISGNNPLEHSRERPRHVLNIEYGVAAKSLAVASESLGRHVIIGVEEAMTRMRRRTRRRDKKVPRATRRVDQPPSPAARAPAMQRLADDMLDQPRRRVVGPLRATLRHAPLRLRRLERAHVRRHIGLDRGVGRTT